MNQGFGTNQGRTGREGKGLKVHLLLPGRSALCDLKSSSGGGSTLDGAEDWT